MPYVGLKTDRKALVEVRAKKLHVCILDRGLGSPVCNQLWRDLVKANVMALLIR